MNKNDEARCDRKYRSTPCSCWLCSPVSRKRKIKRRMIEMHTREQRSAAFEHSEDDDATE